MNDLEKEIFTTLAKKGCLDQAQIACDIIATDEDFVVTREGYQRLYNKLKEMTARGLIVSRYETHTSSVVYSLI